MDLGDVHWLKHHLHNGGYLQLSHNEMCEPTATTRSYFKIHWAEIVESTFEQSPNYLSQKARVLEPIFARQCESYGRGGLTMLSGC
jgi:hypothetical protein